MHITIGVLSRQTGETVKTLRYWTNQGLLTHTVTENQYRKYPPESLQEVHFIRQAQKLGWSLKDIKAILQQGCSGESECSTVISELKRHIQEIEEKIQHLEALKRNLKQRLQWADSQVSLDCTSSCCVILLAEA